MTGEPRLGYAIDTSGLVNAKAAQDALTASGVRLGQTADSAAIKVSQIGRDGQGQLRGTTQDVRALEAALKAASDAAEKAKKALPPNWEELGQKGRMRWVLSNQTAFNELGRSSQEVKKLEGELRNAQSSLSQVGSAMEVASGRAAFLGGALGAVAGIIAFQFVGAISSALAELARIPIESARAADSLNVLGAQLRFAFGGSAELARQARQDIARIADTAGRPFDQVAREYTDIAIAGRSAGLSRGQVSGLASSFSTLGLISGADSARTGRALYQVQQGIAVGRLNYQDYRLASASMPALDDALAAGLGVDPSRIPGMISRGEINTERLVEGLTRGVEILADDAEAIPATMERASNRLKSQWNLLMAELGQSLRSSDFFQGLSALAESGVRRARRQVMSDEDYANTGVPAEQIRTLPSGTPILAFGDINADIERVGREIDRFNSPEARRQRADAARTEAERTRRAQIGQAVTTAMGFDTLESARANLRNSLEQMQRGLASATSPQDIALISAGIGRAQTQLADIMTAYARALREADLQAQDLAAYGPGAYRLSQNARGIYNSARAQGEDIGMPNALALARGNLITDTEADLGLAANDNARRQLIVNAAGSGVAERRRAQLDAEEAAFRERFGRAEHMSPEQRAAVDALARDNRRLSAERFAQDDVQALRERERADRERVEAMRAQLALGTQLGQQGRIALAQAERERDLRRQFPAITDELLRVERERVAEGIRVSEQLDIQVRRMALLSDSAETAGASIGDAFGAMILNGVRSGQEGAEAALESLSQSAERILGNLLRRLTLPLEKRVEEWAAGGLERAFGDGNQNGLTQLTEAAGDAAKSLASQMTPSLAKSAVELAVSTKATAAEALAKNAATANLIIFTKSVMAATAALQSMAGQDTGSKIASAFLPKFASGTSNYPGGWAVMNEMGGEVVKLPRGSTVYPHGTGPEGAKVSINIIDQRSGDAAPVETRETRGANGERQIEVFVRDQVKQSVRRGDVDPEMRAQYGAGRVLKKL